ncbi:MAG: hypothetical protein IJS81_09735 [Selenomonadaceae bacterium]|nr:hypothetical protein [Selenomonadaceae bacterium]MBQ7630474.1 hypothetical protein [Selenomonadaceae bacterium]
MIKLNDVVKAGPPDTAVFVVTNADNIDFKFISGMQAKTGETVIATC